MSKYTVVAINPIILVHHNSKEEQLETWSVSTEGKLRQMYLNKDVARALLGTLDHHFGQGLFDALRHSTSLVDQNVKVFLKEVLFAGRGSVAERNAAKIVYGVLTNFISNNLDIAKFEVNDPELYVKVSDPDLSINPELSPFVVFHKNDPKDVRTIKTMGLLNGTGLVEIGLHDTYNFGEGLFNAVRDSTDGYQFGVVLELSGGSPHSTYFAHSLPYSTERDISYFKLIKSTKRYTDSISFIPTKELAEFMECCYSDIRKLRTTEE